MARITDTAARAAMKATATDRRERTLADGEGRGSGRLVLRIRPTPEGSAGQWAARFTEDAGGRTVRRFLPIGRFPDLSLAEARRRFTGAAAERQAGEPAAAVREAARPTTVGDVLRSYVDHLAERGAPSAVDARRVLLTGPACAAARLGEDRPARSITGDDVARWLHPIGRRAPTMARVSLAYLRAAFGRACRRHVTDDRPPPMEHNPCDGITADPPRARDRVLTAAELRAWWHGFPDHAAPRTVAVLRLALLTGSRPTEAMAARPADFDLAAGTWRKPRTKAGHPWASPLPPMAAAAARDLIATAGDGLTVRALSRAVWRWCDRQRGEPWTVRDLRRTWRTWNSEAGEPSDLLNLAANHDRTGVAAKHYDRAVRWPERVALAERWEARVAAIICAKPKRRG